MIAKDIERAAVYADVRTWFEMHGTIVDKKRRKRRTRVLNSKEETRLAELKAKEELTDKERDEMGFLEGLHCNKMQWEIGEIIKVCRRRGIPVRIVTLKGRQQGSSTFSVGVANHELRRRPAKCCIIGDEFEKSVKNLKQMFHDYAHPDNDKFDWRNTFTPTNGKFSHGSELITETANDSRAGASGTMQVLICTEVAHWPENPGGKISARAVFAALLNCVPEDEETIVIVESTPNGASGVYYETYKGGVSLEDYLAGKIPENWNGYFKVSYFWWEHPEYDLKITESQEHEILNSLTEREHELREELRLPVSRLAWRRKTLKSPKFNSDEEKFEQEYPSDEDRCFLLSGRRAFPLVNIQKMKKEARAMGPVKFGMLQWVNEASRVSNFCLTSEDEAIVKIFEGPRPGCRYVLPVDPMTGASATTGADPDSHGAGIIRCGFFESGAWRPPILAARLADCFAERREKRGRAVCRWDIDVLERYVAMLSRYYGGATIVPEMNMDRGLVELLKVRGGMNIYRRKQFNRIKQKEEETYGWMTTAQTRGPILENLKKAVRMQGEPGDGVIIPDMPVIGEFETMVVMPNGKEEAMGGAHDDQVMMMAIGLVTQDSAAMMPFPSRGRRGGAWDDDDEPARRDFSCS